MIFTFITIHPYEKSSNIGYIMRCFLAIELTEELKEDIEKLQKNFLGDVDEKTLEKIKNLDLSIHPIKTPIKELGVFPNENYIKIIWVGAPKLTNILKEIDEKF